MMPACTEDVEMAQAPAESSDKVEVTLNLGGDFLTTYDSPITRAPFGRKLYGVNVYYSDESDKNDKGVYQYSNKYAYGIFDDLSKIKLTISSKYTYKFEVAAIEENADLFYTYTDGNAVEHFSYPFIKLDKFASATDELLNVGIVKNTFELNSTTNLTEIKNGKSYLVINDNGMNVATEKNGEDIIFQYSVKNYPCTDRFYGEFDGFSVKADTTANITLKRTAFAILMKVVPPENGNLNIYCKDLIDIDVPAQSTDTVVVMDTKVSFSDVYNCWKYALEQDKGNTVKADDVKKYLQNELTFKFTRTRADGSQQNFSEKVTFDRNVRKVITVKAESMSEEPIVINEDANIEKNDTLVIE